MTRIPPQEIMFIARRRRHSEACRERARDIEERDDRYRRYGLVANAGGVGIIATIVGGKMAAGSLVSLPSVLLLALTAYAIGAHISMQAHASDIMLRKNELYKRIGYPPQLLRHVQFLERHGFECSALWARVERLARLLASAFFVAGSLASLGWLWCVVPAQ